MLPSFIQITPECPRALILIPVGTPELQPLFYSHCYVGQNHPMSLRLMTTVKLRTMQLSKRRKSWCLVRSCLCRKRIPCDLSLLKYHASSADSSGLLSSFSEFLFTYPIQMKAVMTVMTVRITKKLYRRSRKPRSPSVTRAEHCLLRMTATVTKSLRTSLARIRVKIKNPTPTRTRTLIPILTLERAKIIRRQP